MIQFTTYMSEQEQKLPARPCSQMYASEPWFRYRFPHVRCEITIDNNKKQARKKQPSHCHSWRGGVCFINPSHPLSSASLRPSAHTLESTSSRPNTSSFMLSHYPLSSYHHLSEMEPQEGGGSPVQGTIHVPHDLDVP